MRQNLWRYKLKSKTIGIILITFLTIIAIPAYRNYITRAKVTKIVELFSKDAANIAEYYATAGKMPGEIIITDPAKSDYLVASNYTHIDYHTSLLTYILGAHLGPSDAKGEIVVTGTGSVNGITWDCTGGDFPSKYRPTKCRA